MDPSRNYVLCDGCKSLQLGQVFLDARFNDPGFTNKIDASSHPGLHSMAELRNSAVTCSACALIFDQLAHKVTNRVDRSPGLMVGDGFSRADCERASVRVEVLRVSNRMFVHLSLAVPGHENAQVSARLRLCHPSEVIPLWPKTKEVQTSLVRYVALDPHSPGSVQLLNEWLTSCTDHASCETPSNSYLPDRIIDLGSSGSRSLRLVEHCTVPGPYVALSYSWGVAWEKQFKTTRDRLAAFKISIDEKLLPQTFRDAILVTRQLGVQYLWIDALCIMQDDSKDWEEQSSKMADVYRESYLTVCASNALSVAQGFLRMRQPAVVPCGSINIDGDTKDVPIYLVLETTGTQRVEDHVRNEPLSSRGWALQERILPGRRIFFTLTQMIWQCRSLQATESEVTSRKNADFSLEALLWEPSVRGEPAARHIRWRRIVQEFTGCALSHLSDRLPAVAGLASDFARLTGEEYIAGHWVADLPLSLLWKNRDDSGGGQRSVPLRAPTWSWASMDGPVGYGGALTLPGGMIPIVEILDHGISLKGVNTFGEVTAGWLSLSATIYKTYVHPHDQPLIIELRAYVSSGPSESPLDAIVDGYYMDEVQDWAPRGQLTPVWLVLVAQLSYIEDEDVFGGIAIVPIDASGAPSTIFRRVGCFHGLTLKDHRKALSMQWSVVRLE